MKCSLTALLALSLAASAARADTLGLAEVLARIDARGPDQAVAAALVDVTRSDVVTARALPNPLLFLGFGRSEPIFNASLALRLPIFGQRGAQIEAAERGLIEARAVAESTRWRLRHDGRIAYYASARADEAVRFAEAAEGIGQHVADMARRRFEEGAGTRLDREQGALLHVRALQEVLDRRAAARVTRVDLARLLGLPVEQLGTLSDALGQAGPTPPLDQLLDGARARHPELRALFAERDAALARARSARADRRPVPTLELGIELLEPTTCDGFAGTTNGPRCIAPRGALSFDLPVLNLNAGPIARAEAEARLAVARHNAALVRVEAEVRSAWESSRAAAARAQFFDAEYVPAANSVEQMARESYAEGKTGLIPLLEAERAVLDARAGRVDSLYAVQAARADLEGASGVPLSTP